MCKKNNLHKRQFNKLHESSQAAEIGYTKNNRTIKFMQ